MCFLINVTKASGRYAFALVSGDREEPKYDMPFYQSGYHYQDEQEALFAGGDVLHFLIAHQITETLQ